MVSAFTYIDGKMLLLKCRCTDVADNISMKLQERKLLGQVTVGKRTHYNNAPWTEGILVVNEVQLEGRREWT